MTPSECLFGTWATVSCWAPESGIPYKESVAAMNNISEADTETAVEQIWRYDTVLVHVWRQGYFLEMRFCMLAVVLKKL